MRFLIVEDDAILLRAMRSTFIMSGHDVLEARDSSRAQSLLHEERPDALVTDLSVPGHALQLVNEAARHYPEMRVVVYSGRPQPDGLPAGVRFVQKPMSPFDLVALIEDWK